MKKTQLVIKVFFESDKNHWSNLDDYLFTIAANKGWNNSFSIKIEYLKDIKKIAKDIATKFSTVATIAICKVDKNGYISIKKETIL